MPSYIFYSVHATLDDYSNRKTLIPGGILFLTRVLVRHPSSIHISFHRQLLYRQAATFYDDAPLRKARASFTLYGQSGVASNFLRFTYSLALSAQWETMPHGESTISHRQYSSRYHSCTLSRTYQLFGLKMSAMGPKDQVDLACNEESRSFKGDRTIWSPPNMPFKSKNSQKLLRCFRVVTSQAANMPFQERI